MKKWIILCFIICATPLYAGTISTVSKGSKTAEISISQEEGRGLMIDDTVYLKGRNNEFTVKGKIQALLPKRIVVSVDFGLDTLKVNDYVSISNKADAIVQSQVSAVQRQPQLGEKRSEMAITLMYWLGGTVTLGDFGIDADKEAGLVFKFSYDNIAADGSSFGFFAHLAPSVTITYAGISGEGSMQEFGIQLKALLSSQSEMEMKGGIGFGYRMFTNSNIEAIDAFGVNGMLQFIPKTTKNKMFFDVGFLSQPTGGNSDTSVTFGPILYIGGGILL